MDEDRFRKHFQEQEAEQARNLMRSRMRNALEYLAICLEEDEIDEVLGYIDETIRQKDAPHLKDNQDFHICVNALVETRQRIMVGEDCDRIAEFLRDFDFDDQGYSGPQVPSP